MVVLVVVPIVDLEEALEEHHTGLEEDPVEVCSCCNRRPVGVDSHPGGCRKFFPGWILETWGVVGWWSGSWREGCASFSLQNSCQGQCQRRKQRVQRRRGGEEEMVKNERL